MTGVEGRMDRKKRIGEKREEKESEEEGWQGHKDQV